MAAKPKFNLEDLPLVHLNEDGTVTCRNCGKRLEFLPAQFPPEELPAGAPRSVNHAGCPNSVPFESPAGPDFERGLHETINRLDQQEVADFYARKAAK